MTCYWTNERFRQGASRGVPRVILAICLVLASCPGGKEKEKDENGKSEDLKFHITFPPSWEKAYDYAGTDVLARSPKENENDSFRENVSVEVVFAQSGTSLEGYFEAYVTDLEKRLDRFRKLDSGAARIGQLDARWVSYAHAWEGKDIQAKLYILIDKTRVYGITAASVPSDFARFETTFDHIVASFKPK